MTSKKKIHIQMILYSGFYGILYERQTLCGKNIGNKPIVIDPKDATCEECLNKWKKETSK